MINVRYFAAAAAAAETSSESRQADTLGELVDQLRGAHGPDFALVLDRCTLLVDGRYADDPATPLSESSTVDVLPPFAGG